LESDSVYTLRTIPQIAWPQAISLAHNPPASRKVLESLATHLTPPHSLTLQPERSLAGRGAYDALAAHCLVEAHRPDPSIRWAYDACTEVIRDHSKSFYFSARLLPHAKRHGIMALYAFCRVSDDIVDSALEVESRAISRVKARLALDAWARSNAGAAAKSEHPVVLAWADARNRFGIPHALADELINGVQMDLTIDRYETWNDLWPYCYRVASTVGLMSMYITGADTMDAVPYAVQLGVALQLTNILRDVGEDARAGRIYLPAEDMERFGYTEEMLTEGVVNRSFVELMEFEIERAMGLYRAAWPGIHMLPKDSRLGVAAAATMYRGILQKIRKGGYDVFNRRAHLSGWEKVKVLPGLWRSVKREA